MNDLLFWLIVIVVLFVAVTFIYFLFGRAAAVNLGHCDVDVHYWFFFKFVRCKGGSSCPAGETCTLMWRIKGSNEEWREHGVFSGGSTRYNENMEYRCNCR